MNKSLKDEILELIETKREGTYWDFKEECHGNNAELLHDILCLSNAQYKGDRFLILGVSNSPNCEIKGVADDRHRKSQAQFIDFIRSKHFAGDIRPEIELRTETVGKAEIDVLIVFDRPQKPFYLREEYRDKADGGSPVTVRANSIYTRTLDTNTPINKSADVPAIASMWRERFGLDVSPMEKVKLYLLEYGNWEWDGVDFAYYKYFPEFTIKIGSSSVRNDKSVWWDQWPVGEPLRESIYEIKYHSTQLAKLQVIRCDREDISFPHPDVGYIQIDDSKHKKAENTYSLFYYVKDTLDYSLLHHLFRGDLTSIQSCTKPTNKKLPFMIFENDEDRGFFMYSLEKDIGEFFSEHPGFPQKGRGEKMLQEEEEFAGWAYKRWESAHRSSTASFEDGKTCILNS